jgi:hypothetical protein
MQQRRIKRDYRQLRNSPTKFLPACKKIRQSLSDKLNYPDSWWGGNLPLRDQCFEKVDALEVSCHLASDGGKSLIRERDKLIEEVIPMLDEIASLLESGAVRNPDLLLKSGFSLTKERRSQNRARLPLTASTDFVVVNLGELGKAKASASSMPGGWNQEIHINTKDPSAEADWIHKDIFADPGCMVMENLAQGNTFFRMRHHGPDGAGPWSPTVSLFIT